jgi:CHAT domain-containing protein
MGHTTISGKELKYANFIDDVSAKYPEIAEFLKTKNIKATDDEIYTGTLKNKLYGYNLYHLISYYCGLVSNPSLSNEEKERRDYIAKGLYSVLFGQIENFMDGKNDLIMIPSGIMSKLPFETLITPNNKYLVEKYNIKYAQSLNLLNALNERKYTADRKPLIAFGGAVYNKDTYDTDMKASAAQLAALNKRNVKSINVDDYVMLNLGVLQGKGWENLPSTLTEVQAIGKIAGKSDIYTGNDVNKIFVKQLSDSGKLKDYKVIHLATHGFMLGIKNGSSLVLSIDKTGWGSFLWSADIAKLDIKADFVNLSACETAIGNLTRSGGQEGLNQAFFIAGANSVCSSLWPVADQSTMKFMGGVYKLVDEKKMSYDQAMTEMKRQFIYGSLDQEADSNTARGLQVKATGPAAPSNKYSDPYYWAPFVYNGK